ncbi:cell wall anchor protein [Winogradskyella sp.]|uniref:cell wall anchor protein n=1 Tax=Winogradskyella sp. TaxID=1883156 RepID=UPI003AA95126
MRIPLILILTLCFFVSYSQVGIGTTEPDPSSILELNSTSQGLLTPRMTTALRTAIDSPAEGLIVYDTDQSSFYYYSSGSWIPLEGADIRNNYKLVKSVADLSEELDAGGGSEYLLNTNFLYEINGEVVFDFPINLNGAYVEGRDTGSDIMVNASGSTLFTGSNGGNLKTLRIDAGDQEVFNITGSGSQSVVAYTLIINNASSLGTLSNLYAVLFDILQVVNTDDGLTASDMTSFFMDKIFWTDSNTGTFLTLSGSFNNLQIANGRIVSNAGEVGIDVSSNPTINVSASISKISFDGEGTRVNSYTNGTYNGYNFTTDYFIESPGIPREMDDNATGNIVLNAAYGSGIYTNFTGTGTASRRKINGATSSDDLFRFSASGNNRIVYEGRKTRRFTINASLSFRGDTNNDIFVFYIAKGNSGNATATVDENTKVYREIGSNFDVGAVSITGSIELSTGDYIEVWAERLLGSGDLLVASMNMVAR